MEQLNAESILKADDTGKPERVDVPEWGGYVHVRVMSGVERDRWEHTASKGMAKVSLLNLRASLVAYTACDESGKRLFTDNQASNLGIKSAVALDRVFDVAQRVNCLTENDIKEIEGNLHAVPSGNSG